MTASGRFSLEAHEEALRAAAKRIIPRRRMMSLKDAEDIVAMEFRRPTSR